MSTERFVRKLLIRIVVLIIICTITFSLNGAITTILNNHIAIGQLENDDAAFLTMELFNNALRPSINIIGVVVIIAVVASSIYDTIKFIKNKRMTNE